MTGAEPFAVRKETKGSLPTALGGRGGSDAPMEVWAAGQRIDPRAVRSRIAYVCGPGCSFSPLCHSRAMSTGACRPDHALEVMQKDEMFATATPREAPPLF